MPKITGPGLLGYLYKLPTCTTVWLLGFCVQNIPSVLFYLCSYSLLPWYVILCVAKIYWFSFCIATWRIKVFVAVAFFHCLLYFDFLRQSPYVVLAVLALAGIPGLPQTQKASYLRLLSAGITGLYYHIHWLQLITLYIRSTLGYICFETSNTTGEGVCILL